MLHRLVVRCNVDAASVGPLVEHAEHRELCAHRLARPGGGREEGVVRGVVERVVDLRLDGVEGGKVGVEALEGGVAEGRDREGLEVEELRAGGELLREDEVPEGDGDDGLGAKPAVADHLDKVLGGHGLVHGHGEGDGVLLLDEPPLEDKDLIVQRRLPVDVLHHDVEELGGAVHLVVPLEIWRDGQLHLEHVSGDWLHRGRELQLGELVDELVHRLAHLREADQLPDLLGRHVEEALPAQHVLLLELLDDLDGDLGKLPQGDHAAPHPPVHHLAQAEGAEREARPPSAEHNLEQGAHEAPRALGNVRHVRHEGKALELQL
mmetsp:Transcript_1320/g.3148  ORF Transcript_1320/g.3148 Transcript_1320/m.3148 type:complete len:321 (-) Transcript_1320:715-1677(-)